MSDDKTLERSLALVHALYKRTRDGAVDWQDVGTVDMFDAAFGDFRLRIRLVYDPDYPNEPDYLLDVMNAHGGTIETISNISLRPLSDRLTNEGLNPYTVLRQIFDMARRKALNVDEAIESILGELVKKR
jgi:hypothetical protein